MRYQLGSIVLIALLVAGCGSSDRLSSGAVDASKAADTALDTSDGSIQRQSMTPRADSTAPDAGKGGPAAGEHGFAANPAGGVAPISLGQTQVGVQRAVVRNAALTVRVKNVEQAERKAGQYVTGFGGYVEGSESNDLSSDQAEITMTVRVPVRSFDEAIVDFEGLGTRISKKISGEDVTGKILDYDARLKTMRAQEDVYRGLLKQSRNLESVVEMQQKLMELREQIESTAAQLKGLGELSALSTIELKLSQSMDAVVSRPVDVGWAQESWAQAKGAGFAFYRAVVVVIMWLVMFCPVWLGGLLLVRWVVKAVAPKPSSASASPPPPPVQL